MKELNDKYKDFCKHYVRSNNASEAARLAGFAPKSAPSEGCRLLKRPDVSEYIAKLKEEKHKEFDTSYKQEAIRLKDKQYFIQKTLENFIEEPSRAAKNNYWALLCKLQDHLNESEAKNIFINNLSHDQKVEKAKALFEKLRNTVQLDSPQTEVPTNKEDTA